MEFAESELEKARQAVNEARAALLEAESRRAMTSADGTSLNVLAGEYQELTATLEFALDTYRLALSGVEAARVESTRKLKSLVLAQSPSVPEAPEHPRRAYLLFALLIGLTFALRHRAARRCDHRGPPGMRLGKLPTPLPAFPHRGGRYASRSARARRLCARLVGPWLLLVAGAALAQQLPIDLDPFRSAQRAAAAEAADARAAQARDAAMPSPTMTPRDTGVDAADNAYKGPYVS